MDLYSYFQTRDTSQDTTIQMPWEVKGATRADLPAYFKDKGFTRGAEIGVWAGEYSEELCQGNPNLHLLCVDPWTSYPQYAEQRRYEKVFGQRGYTRAYNAAVTRLAPYNCELRKGFSVDVAATIPDQSLDFVYIDGNHCFEYVVADLAAWTPKVRDGGIIAGHDYKNWGGIQVKPAVHGWTEARRIRPWFVLGRLRVCNGERTEAFRSYLWTKT